MKVFKIHRNYRRIGPGYGLPVFYIDMGFGLSLKVEEILVKLGTLGIYLGSTVVVRNSPLKQQGIAVLVDAIKSTNLRIEIEEDGTTKDPIWMPKVDRWIVNWVKDGPYNYAGMRPRQDLIICTNEDIEQFIQDTEEFGALKAVISENPGELWGRVKDHDIRVYEKEQIV